MSHRAGEEQISSDISFFEELEVFQSPHSIHSAMLQHRIGIECSLRSWNESISTLLVNIS
jgi:hypothetical protein